MDAYVYPIAMMFGCASFIVCGFVSLEDLVRRFRKRRRMEKYILYLESSIYWREATGGGELRSLSGLITEMGDEDLEYLGHGDRLCRLLIFATERCTLLSSSERGYASHCADWLRDRLSNRYAEYVQQRMFIDAVLDTIETLYGLAWRLDPGMRIRIANLRDTFERCE